MITSLIEYLTLLYVAAPVIDTPSSSTVRVAVGCPLTLSCTSRGSPPDTFTWRKDNDSVVLQSTSITPVTYSASSAVFCANYSIVSANTSDSGTYTCNVTNPIGSDIAAITVVVTGKLLLCLMTTIIYLTGFWKTDWNVTLGLFHFIDQAMYIIAILIHYITLAQLHYQAYLTGLLF